jgi:transcriptional regulator with XRE-family HTH domain
MSVAEWKGSPEGTSHDQDKPAIGPPTNPQPTERRLHRIHTIRKQQGMSIRSVARRLKISVEQARIEENETSDITLGALFRWQQALDVPVTHLLVDLDGPISEPVLKRARLLKMMKTATSIGETAKTEQVKRLSQMLVDQLVELMPELKDVSPWHLVGQRRSLNEYGRVVERQLPDNMFHD